MPYEEMRLRQREFFGKAYIEIYVKASVEKCAGRDVKGLYKLNKEGKLGNLSGSDDAFELPTKSEITIDTDSISIDEGCAVIIEYLRNNKYID
jgi:adenylylsulfate kinase